MKYLIFLLNFSVVIRIAMKNAVYSSSQNTIYSIFNARLCLSRKNANLPQIGHFRD